ncbi:hypothetical protein HMPREF0580_0824 [Mobiluncus mulieris ATCC 35239]|uniref:Uncharacterized protein n=4 Tax=Mobiluncus mulieris TaxID=2052 RepID=E0QPK9_9ACTO|nr:hypothetical protein HMPREF0580_0824 [Mobiluncus mulieris ATCC 35239]MCU9972188.1 hypothetical protein [Mobiluncus mulieris]MCU9976619.1 hypothetical protein [Mobiluncus mulieris]MCU9995148.1 hypothetical protein [Mobiluncus mulieris]MCV0003461.1 hypothetical protein [Mobiluncus mulieris]
MRRVSKFWAQFWGFSLARVRKSPPMSVGRSLILEMENTDESGAAGASRGAACDEVSAQVLVLNLPLEGTAPAVALAGATPNQRGWTPADGQGTQSQAAPEPTWLTLRSLRGGGCPTNSMTARKNSSCCCCLTWKSRWIFRVLHRELPQANPLVTALQTGATLKILPTDFPGHLATPVYN